MTSEEIRDCALINAVYCSKMDSCEECPHCLHSEG